MALAGPNDREIVMRRAFTCAMIVGKPGLLLGVLILTACDSHRPTSATNSGPAGTPRETPSGGVTDPQATFIAAFRQASERKDIDQMLKLYCWDGVDSELRETIRGNVRDELLQSVADLKIEAPSPGKFGPTVEGGVR